MLLDMAVGDAVGSAFEFAPSSYLLSKGSEVTYKKHPTRPEHVPGTYSDDTQTALAIAELLLDGKSATKSNVIEYIFRAYKRNPRPNTYTKGFQAILDSSYDSDEVIARLHGNSTKCGAAVRAVPFGFLPDLATVISEAALQAMATHDSPEGIVGSQVIACSAYYFLRFKGHPNILPSYIQSVVEARDLNIKWDQTPDLSTPLSVQSIDLAHRVLWLLANHSDQATLLDSCIASGGDTDSLAAVCMALSALTAHYKHNIPDNLYWDLEGGYYGRGYLESTTDNLSRVFEVQVPR